MTCLNVPNLQWWWVLCSLLFYFAGIVTCALIVYAVWRRRQDDAGDVWAGGVEAELRAAAEEWPARQTPSVLDSVRGPLPVVETDLPAQYGTRVEHARRVQAVQFDADPAVWPAWEPPPAPERRRWVRALLRNVFAVPVYAARLVGRVVLAIVRAVRWSWHRFDWAAQPVRDPAVGLREPRHAAGNGRRAAAELTAELQLERARRELPAAPTTTAPDAAPEKPRRRGWYDLTGQFTVVATVDADDEQERLYQTALADLLRPGGVEEFVEAARRRDTILGLQPEEPIPVAVLQ